jgi:hypothetical protein
LRVQRVADADLPEIVGAGGAMRRFASGGEGGKQYRRQKRENGEDDQQFDESETGSTLHVSIFKKKAVCSI